MRRSGNSGGRIGPSLQKSWDRRAAANFIAGGCGSGLAILSSANALWSGNLEPSAFAAAAVLIALGLLFVWFEIGRPWRFLHVFFHPQTSWMTREAALAPPLLVALAATALSANRAAAAASALLALAFLATQARILRAARGIPAWREPLIQPLILSTGLAEGAGAALLFFAFAPVSERLFLSVLALAAVALRQFAWRFYCRRLESRGAPKGALAALQAIDKPVLWAATLAPFLFLLATFAFPLFAAPFAVTAGVSAIFGGVLIKGVIVTRAAFNQGFALPDLPGLAGTGGGASTRPGRS